MCLPCPGWSLLDAVRAARFTGELRLAVSPPATVHLDRGCVYLAEHETDPPLGERLVAAGVLDDEQLRIGTIAIGDRRHLGRLFERAPGVDRAAVLTATEVHTEECLARIAGQEVPRATAVPYRYHPSGVHRWDLRPSNEARDATTPAADSSDPASERVSASVTTNEPALDEPLGESASGPASSGPPSGESLGGAASSGPPNGESASGPAPSGPPSGESLGGAVVGGRALGDSLGEARIDQPLVVGDPRAPVARSIDGRRRGGDTGVAPTPADDAVASASGRAVGLAVPGSEPGPRAGGDPVGSGEVETGQVGPGSGSAGANAVVSGPGRGAVVVGGTDRVDDGAPTDPPLAAPAPGGTPSVRRVTEPWLAPSAAPRSADDVIYDLDGPGDGQSGLGPCFGLLPASSVEPVERFEIVWPSGRIDEPVASPPARTPHAPHGTDRLRRRTDPQPAETGGPPAGAGRDRPVVSGDGNPSIMGSPFAPPTFAGGVRGGLASSGGFGLGRPHLAAASPQTGSVFDLGPVSWGPRSPAPAAGSECVDLGSEDEPAPSSPHRSARPFGVPSPDRMADAADGVGVAGARSSWRRDRLSALRRLIDSFRG